MARAVLLLDLVRGGARGDQVLFRKALEALIAEERAKQHHILADRLAAHLQANSGTHAAPVAPSIQRNSPRGELYYETVPERRLEDLLLPEVVRGPVGSSSRSTAERTCSVPTTSSRGTVSFL
jgi:hypothetical protein